MRALLVVLSALMLSTPMAHAAGVDDIVDLIGGVIGGEVNRRPPPAGGVRCSAQDRGWEEHFGGHASCRECVARHGSCVETCSYTQWTCIVEGRRWGRPAQFEGYGYSEHEAAREAYDNCERRGGRFCRQVGPCRADNRSERRECERFERPEPPRPRPPGGGGRPPGRPGRPGRP